MGLLFPNFSYSQQKKKYLKLKAIRQKVCSHLKKINNIEILESNQKRHYKILKKIKI